MRRITLDEAWKLCLDQWTNGVIKKIEAGTKKDIEELKEEWCEDNGYRFVKHDCFFCEYGHQHQSAGDDCAFCPGRLVDPEFQCTKPKYYWEKNPLAFHAEIERLYKIYKEAQDA